jgi:hypothetical protein
MGKLQLYVAEKYLLKKKDMPIEVVKSLSRIENNFVNQSKYSEGKSFLISLGGENPVFKSSSMYHFRPKGIGSAHRVMYSLASDLTSHVRSNFKIPNETVVFFDITSEKDHERNAKIASNLRDSQEEQIYKTLVTVKSDINIENSEEVYESYFGFPIDHKQQLLLNIKPPVVIIGSAGSGKTVTALELFKRFYLDNTELKTVFLTLTEKLKIKIKDELEKCNFQANNILTFAEFSGIEYRDQEFYIKIIQKIIETLINNNYHTKFKKLVKNYPFFFNKNSIFTIIRGYLKGRLNANSDYNIFKREELRNQIEELAREENYKIVFNDDYEDAIKYLEFIFKEYEAIKLVYDDNDFQEKNNNYYDCIIVDEVQDLTEKQIRFIVRSLDKKSNLLFLYGDPNQTINPTFFSFNRLKGIVSSLTPHTITKESLKETYRSGPNLIKYINHLSDLRKKMIGTQSDSWDEHEKSLLVRPDEKWACLVERKDTIKRLFEIFNNSDDCIIIVNSEDEKLKLKNEYSEFLSQTDLIFSITEIKGLEHKNIISFNLIDSNYQRFEEMISGKFKYSTIHRMVFNRFYVSLTRATESIIIVEEKLEDRVKLKDLFFNYSNDGYSQKVEEVDENIDLVENYISQSKNPEAFVRSARKFKDNGYYFQSKEKLMKALELALEDEQYRYLEDKIRKELDIIDLILDYYSKIDIYSDREKQIFFEKLLLMNEYNEALKIGDKLRNSRELNELVKYFKGSNKLINITPFISNDSIIMNEVYEMLSIKTGLLEDAFNYIGKIEG